MFHCLAAFFVSLVISSSALGSIKVSKSWAREMPPGSSVTAIYLQIANQGKTAVALKSVSSPIGKAEIHETKMEDGMMSMEPISSATLGPGKTLTLSPKGLHIMILGVSKPLRQGDVIPLTLSFETAHTINIKVPVKSY
ncbi:copper chaperone PCu(A)C [Pseudobacteriovorax antillogorgiicola]|uniref:Copper(I)-binding protein n=1 Tax=Pseudobacteriovorax antillogorgiicola TaxID=1513793 RepID=A0A1Y6CPE1_9BACT|nr:copper chaperone PCu(A)C [Pseudobacteriovorax antillogorgiicola]TCS44434.1 hypothetical protein EDD56_13361 [Pseudobacteriovorax antillogorgiicola]SMF78941.1 hypothetical protein SAMN06296036_13313 [Pseudobacteriovorax antillogorgiicola]